MKRAAIITLVGLIIVGAGYGLARAHGGYGWSHMGSDYGHMGYRGGIGGMMDYYRAPGYDADQGCGSYNTQTRTNLTEKDAEEIVAYRFTRNNPNLMVGKVKGTEDGFEVQIVTKKGEALVDRLLVEKDTGRIYRVYE